MNLNFMIGALAAVETLPFGERLAEGFEVFILGILMVFAVLALLWGVLVIFKVVFYDIPEKRKKAKANETKTEVAPAPAAVSAPAPVPAQDDGAIVAAITAALSEYFAQSGEYTGGFRVVSFKKSQTGSAWNRK